MKNKILSAFLAFSLLSGGNTVLAKGIPTHDYLGYIEDIAQHKETLQQWANQIREMEKHYKAISGINSWEDLLNSKYFWDFFPEEAEDLLSEEVPTEEIEKRINDAIKDNDSFEEFKNREVNKIAQRQARAKENYDKAIERTERLNDLIETANENETIKQTLDYNNAMQGEIAQLINEMTRLISEMQVYESANNEQDKIEKERADKAVDMSGGAKVYPLK